VVIDDGKRFISAGSAEEPGLYEVRIHEWPTGRVLHTFTGHRAPIIAMTLSPDGKTLATGSQDATVLLWDMSDVK
jgi:WD40 repeat protein